MFLERDDPHPDVFAKRHVTPAAAVAAGIGHGRAPRARHRRTSRGTRMARSARRTPIRPRRRAPASGSAPRSEEHTSELQSLMRISYAVFCLKKKNIHNTIEHKYDAHTQQPTKNQ